MGRTTCLRRSRTLYRDTHHSANAGHRTPFSEVALYHLACEYLVGGKGVFRSFHCFDVEGTRLDVVVPEDWVAQGEELDSDGRHVSATDRSVDVVYAKTSSHYEHEQDKRKCCPAEKGQVQNVN